MAAAATGAYGSIPVHTGKPLRVPDPPCPLWVYPRTHGETSRLTTDTTKRAGLSPYTRGNLVGVALVGGYQGSIPVHTGKPVLEWVGLHPQGVYPRTHGETPRSGKTPLFITGLSPYTRGNLYARQLLAACDYSIPVHTGKPFHHPV